MKQFIPVYFDSYQVEEITGVSPDYQRDWRRKGRVGAPRGNTRKGTPIAEVAALLIVSNFRDNHGMYIKQAAQHALTLTNSVLGYACRAGGVAPADVSDILRHLKVSEDDLKPYAARHGRRWKNLDDLNSIFVYGENKEQVSLVFARAAVAKKLLALKIKLYTRAINCP